MTVTTATRRASQERMFSRLWMNAEAAGAKAAAAATPTPMVVGTPTTPLGSDIDPNQPVYYVAEGVCGFAWVNFPGNTAFARWAKSMDLVRKDTYYGGVTYSPRGLGQSMARKEAFAHAFAAVLREAGVDKVYVMSRMD